MWLYWIGGLLGAFLYDKHVQKQAALQSIDACLLVIQSASVPQANQVASPTTIHTAVGDLKSDPNVNDSYTKMAQALSLQTTAPEWLSLATAAQAAGYPLLSNSIATLGMHLLESGQLGL